MEKKKQHLSLLLKNDMTSKKGTIDIKRTNEDQI